MGDTRQRWLWASVCMALVSMPFLAVDFIPSTDLGQHLGQLRLFDEALTDPTANLKIQWWTPYSLVYALMALPWALFSPVAAGRVSVWLLVLLQAGAIHWIAARWQRPVTGAVLATLFIFHAQLYWGFVNFVFAFCVFLGWYVLSRRSPEDDERNPWRTAALFFLCAAVLYLSHALWFAFGLLWLALEALISRRSFRNVFWRAVGVAPVVLMALYWFAFLRGTSFSSPPVWDVLFMRLHPKLFALRGLGGLRHEIEPIIVVVALLWAVAALLSRRKERYFGCDPYLLSLAGLFLLVYLTVPDKFANTIRFSARWLPYFFISLLLAVGVPKLRRRLRRAVVVVLLLTHMVVTTAYWRAFEARELSGLPEVLEAIEGEPRVIGLSYIEASRYVSGRPFIQIFAWAYAVHGGMLNFSFADFAPSLVVYRANTRSALGDDPTGAVRPVVVNMILEPPGDNTWSLGLEWFPKAVRRTDFQFFDYAIIGGDERAHQTVLGGVPELTPVVTGGAWRLYRIERSKSLTPAAPPLAPVESSPTD